LLSLGYEKRAPGQVALPSETVPAAEIMPAV
jgi:hypothetical protein